jgi:polysaccharide export outer membrane protein
MRKILYLLGFLLLFSSCGMLNQNNMFKTSVDYKYATTPDSNKVYEYKISPNDILSFTIYSNDGFKLIDLTAFSPSNNPPGASSAQSGNLYSVEADGNVKLPVLGRKKLVGLTIREAEQMLEESYSAFYVKPFIVAKIINRKVILFPGSTGDAKIIELKDNNTTLVDVIAFAGGISEDGKAKKVKLIRDVNKKHEVYLIDLSTIKGINDAFIVLQANDIIYIEPRKRVSKKAMQELLPLLSLLSTTILSFTLIHNLIK